MCCEIANKYLNGQIFRAIVIKGTNSFPFPGIAVYVVWYLGDECNAEAS